MPPTGSEQRGLLLILLIFTVPDPRPPQWINNLPLRKRLAYIISLNLFGNGNCLELFEEAGHITFPFKSSFSAGTFPDILKMPVFFTDIGVGLVGENGVILRELFFVGGGLLRPTTWVGITIGFLYLFVILSALV